MRKCRCMDGYSGKAETGFECFSKCHNFQLYFKQILVYSMSIEFMSLDLYV